MVKIYGASDDLIEIEGFQNGFDEIDCYDEKVEIDFLDGTIISIVYGKPNLAVWGIKVLREGKANHTLTICEDEEAEIYSDIFEIDSDIERVVKWRK